jgi:glycine hydroxymethyltransferase
MVENALVKADITLNKNMVPFDSRSPFLTSGIRVGSPAMTTRGFKEDHFIQVVEMIDEVIMNIENEAIINKTKEKVHSLVKDFPIFSW